MKVTVDKILGILREQDAVSGGGSSGGSVTIPDATQSASGLMSAADKTKLDGLGENATQSASGLMSAADKVKLDGLGENATQSASGLMSASDKAKLDAVSADINTIGYLKFPGNLIFQWGSYGLSSDPDSREITLPVTVTATYGRFASSSNSAVKLGIAGTADGKVSISASGANSGGVYWMVIGKGE